MSPLYQHLSHPPWLEGCWGLGRVELKENEPIILHMIEHFNLQCVKKQYDNKEIRYKHRLHHLSKMGAQSVYTPW